MMSPFITGELARIHAEELMLEPALRQLRLDARRRRAQERIPPTWWWTRRRRARPVVEAPLPGQVRIPRQRPGSDPAVQTSEPSDPQLCREA